MYILARSISNINLVWYLFQIELICPPESPGNRTQS